MLRRFSNVASLPGELIGKSGTRYLPIRVLQDRPGVGTLWLAESQKGNFVVKDLTQSLYSNFERHIWPQLPISPYIRAPKDRILDSKMMVYDYLDDDLLRLTRKSVPFEVRRRVLRAALTGLADLHDHDIVHLDIKPDNILVDYQDGPPHLTINRVQIIDLENAAHLPPSRFISGMLAGNENWRSPEAHFRCDLHKPTDIFSFAIVCIYTMLNKIIMMEDEDFHHHVAHGAVPGMIRLQRQVSYFGDEAGFSGLLKHIGDGEEMLQKLLRMLWEERSEEHIPYKPFSQWEDQMSDEFRDLIIQMTSLDPTRRISARQALGHPWFLGDA